ncbi:M56 family metallopeptidase [uncultured Clostridium sp.]|uniref:M56 family metallopeptidase n=1 Tax=uncultured Clostridium sp. TaxID=59620 RepID=UPI002615833C|nr:M56 family metallopeptidase [uncultured Clostridium sp.]
MIFDFIIETSIISSFLVILILIVQKIFKNKIAPHIGYYIWMILIVKLLVPINIQSDLSLERLINIEPLRVQQVNNNDSRVMTEEIGMEKTINQKSYFKFLWFFTVSLIFCYGLFLYAKLKVKYKKSRRNKRFKIYENTKKL